MHKARSSAAPLLLALAQSASADIVLSRTVNSLSAGSIKVTLDGGACASSDAYGSNQCDLDWGKSCGPTALAPILPCARYHSERHDHSARPHAAMRLGPLRQMCVAAPDEASVNGTLSKDIESGDTFSASIKVDSVFKLDFTCQLCGAECSFEVPVIKQKVHTGVPNFITAFLLALETQRDLKGEAGRGEPL